QSWRRERDDWWIVTRPPAPREEMLPGMEPVHRPPGNDHGRPLDRGRQTEDNGRTSARQPARHYSMTRSLLLLCLLPAFLSADEKIDPATAKPDPDQGVLW